MQLHAPETDVSRFHRIDLPRRLAGGNGALAARAASRLLPIAFDIDGSSWSYVPRGDGVDIVEDLVETAATIVVVGVGPWRDFLHEHRTAPGLAYAGMVAFRRGDFADLMRWEPVLRAMWQGRPVYDPARLDLTDRCGRPLDLHRAWHLDEPAADVTNFFRKAGFLHLKHVFSPAEIAVLHAEVERLRGFARQGDKRSWWAKDEHDRDTLVRITYCGERSPLIAGLLDDPRMRRIAELAGERLVPVYDRADGQSVLFKIPRAGAGMSDLGWHVDCGLGLHPFLCPTINIGIQLTPGAAATGQLKMAAGSWHCSCELIADPTADVPADYPVVGLDTEAGDCTAHFGHQLHAAPPPTGEGGRVTLYVGYCNPALVDLLGPGEGPNDILFRTADMIVPSLTQVA